MSLILVFLIAWAGYAFLLLSMPILYGGPDAWLVRSALLGWVGLVLVTAFITQRVVHYWVAEGGGARVARPYVDAVLASRLIVAGLLVSALGFVCLVVDKVFIQGIDFSQGVAVARELWRKEAEMRDGVSSVFSVLGYLLGFAFAASTVLLQLHWEHLRSRLRTATVLSVILLVLANSLLTGGRGIILVQAVSVLVVAALRAETGRTWFPGRPLRTVLIAGTLSVLAVGYSLYIFSERARASGIDPGHYALNFIDYLGGRPSDTYRSLEALPDAVYPTVQFGIIAGAYLNHSFATFDALVEYDDHSGSIMFGFLRSLLARLGLEGVAAEEWSLSGRFPSLPGALWHDFGWLGFWAGALVLGACLGATRLVLHLPGGGSMAIAAVWFVGLTAVLSPLLNAADILSVPFMILGMLGCGALLRARLGAVRWMDVGLVVARLSRRSA